MSTNRSLLDQLNEITLGDIEAARNAIEQASRSSKMTRKRILANSLPPKIKNFINEINGRKLTPTEITNFFTKKTKDKLKKKLKPIQGLINENMPNRSTTAIKNINDILRTIESKESKLLEVKDEKDEKKEVEVKPLPLRSRFHDLQDENDTLIKLIKALPNETTIPDSKWINLFNIKYYLETPLTDPNDITERNRIMDQAKAEGRYEDLILQCKLGPMGILDKIIALYHTSAGRLMEEYKQAGGSTLIDADDLVGIIIPLLPDFNDDLMALDQWLDRFIYGYEKEGEQIPAILEQTKFRDISQGEIGYLFTALKAATTEKLRMIKTNQSFADPPQVITLKASASTPLTSHPNYSSSITQMASLMDPLPTVLFTGYTWVLEQINTGDIHKARNACQRFGKQLQQNFPGKNKEEIIDELQKMHLNFSKNKMGDSGQRIFHDLFYGEKPQQTDLDIGLCVFDLLESPTYKKAEYDRQRRDRIHMSDQIQAWKEEYLALRMEMTYDDDSTFTDKQREEQAIRSAEALTHQLERLADIYFRTYPLNPDSDAYANILIAYAKANLDTYALYLKTKGAENDTDILKNKYEATKKLQDTLNPSKKVDEENKPKPDTSSRDKLKEYYKEYEKSTPIFEKRRFFDKPSNAFATILKGIATFIAGALSATAILAPIFIPAILSMWKPKSSTFTKVAGSSPPKPPNQKR